MTADLIDPGDAGEETGFSGELLEAGLVDVDGGERLVEAHVDLAQVEHRVDRLLLLQRRLELLLGVTVHAQPARNATASHVSQRAHARNTAHLHFRVIKKKHQPRLIWQKYVAKVPRMF